MARRPPVISHSGWATVKPAGPQPVAPASKRSTSSGVTYRRCSSGSTSSAKRTGAGEHFNSPNEKPRPWSPNFTPGGFAHGSRGAEVLPGEVTAPAEHCRRHGWVPPHYAIKSSHPSVSVRGRSNCAAGCHGRQVTCAITVRLLERRVGCGATQRWRGR